MTDSKEMGALIRARREELGLAQADLAEALGVTRAQVSNLERGTSGPSFKLLIRLVRILGFGVVQLLEQEAPLTRADVVGPHQRQAVTAAYAEGADIEELVPALAGSIHPYEIVLQPGTGRFLPHTHEGDEWVFVLEGSLQLQVAEQTYVLESGGSFGYSGSVEHGVTNLGSVPARLLSFRVGAA